jgi:type I restriction enzyme S subunit
VNVTQRIRLKFTSDYPLKYGANAAAEFDDPDWPRFVRITDVTPKGALRDDTFRSLPPEVASGYELEEGDILLARSGATVGKSFIYDSSWGHACYAGYLVRSRTASVYSPRFIYWFLQSNEYWADIQANLIQATIQNFSAEKYANIRVPSPSLGIQKRVAAFLDDKTAQIDALLEKKRKLLDRLAEKRQAIITQAVTKGLDPSAPMKDSGIAWLGQIPATWTIIPLKWQCVIRSGQVDPMESPFGDMPLIAPDHIESGTGRLLGLVSASEQAAISGKYLCQPEDVLYSKIRPALRKVVLTDRMCLCSADMYAIAPGADYKRDYLFFFLLTDAFTAYAELESMRVAMPKVNRDAVGSLSLPKPPRHDQEQIVSYLHRSLSKVDVVAVSVRESLAQLAEYRSALITAAVTGQIKELC